MSKAKGPWDFVDTSHLSGLARDVYKCSKTFGSLRVHMTVLYEPSTSKAYVSHSLGSYDILKNVSLEDALAYALAKIKVDIYKLTSFLES